MEFWRAWLTSVEMVGGHVRHDKKGSSRAGFDIYWGENGYILDFGSRLEVNEYQGKSRNIEIQLLYAD